MALSSKKTQPDWKNQQQKNTGTKNSDERAKEAGKPKTATIKLKTNYRDVAKTGDTWTTDAEKADELVRLGRAEYV